MGAADILSSFYKVGRRLSSPVSIMKFFAFLFFVGFSASAIVKRDAEPEAEAEPSGYRTGGYSSAPVCSETPVRECKPRQIENPRQVCQTVYDTHEDTVVTEHCEEIVTTQCTQTSQSATHHSGVVGQTTRLVETGVPRAINHGAAHAVVGHGVGGHAIAGASYGVGHHYKREAEAEPEAEAYGYGRTVAAAPHAVGYVAPVAEQVSAPVCNSVPEKRCNSVPHSTPRKVARTVCDTVVDITTIEDCHETVTRVCQQTSTSHASHSAVVGHDTQVVATGVDVAHHGTVAVGPTVVGHGAVSHGIGSGVVSAGYHH